MNLSTARKRKDDESLSGTDLSPRAKIRRVQSYVHALQIPIMTEDEDEAFPCDRITSDPTFFDDFMPDEPPTPRAALPLCLPPHITSPGPTRCRMSVERVNNAPIEDRSLSEPQGLWLSDDENDGTIIRSEPDLRHLSRITNIVPQKAQTDGTLVPILRTSDHHNSIVMGEEELVAVVQEHTSLNGTEEGRLNFDHAESPVGGIVKTTAIPLIHSDPLPPFQKQLDAMSAGNRARITRLHKPDSMKRVLSKADVLLSPISTFQQPLCTSNDVFTRTSNPVSDVSSVFDFKPNRATKKFTSRPHCDLLKASTCNTHTGSASTTRRRSSKSNTFRMDDMQFEIVHPSNGRAYSVKHQKERTSEIGTQWSRATKRSSIYISITKYARVKYNVDDVVSLDFTAGSGGSAKIVEIRDTNVPFIIVQWLYSRTDAARLGARLPSLDKWPKGLYTLSDHFQVVCIENLNGKSGSIIIEDLYWQISGKCLQPSAEIQRKLQDQLG